MSLSSNLKTIQLLASQLDSLEIFLLSGDVSLEAYVKICSVLNRALEIYHMLDSIVPVVEVELSDEEARFLRTWCYNHVPDRERLLRELRT